MGEDQGGSVRMGQGGVYDGLHTCGLDAKAGLGRQGGVFLAPGDW